MPQQVNSPIVLTQDQFFNGFFSALMLVHGKTLRAKDSEIHRAFHHAFSTSETPVFRRLIEETDYCYDPLYGMSDWLAIGIATAARDLLIERPLTVGRWNDTVIRFERDEANRRLNELGFREEFIALANAFTTALKFHAPGHRFFERFMAAIFVNGGKFWAAPRDHVLPAFRHALIVTQFGLPGGWRVEDISDHLLGNWFELAITHLVQIELLESNSNVFVRDYRIRMTDETVEATLRASDLRDEFAALGKVFLDYLAALPGNCWGVRPRWTADTDPH